MKKDTVKYCPGKEDTVKYSPRKKDTVKYFPQEGRHRKILLGRKTS